MRKNKLLLACCCCCKFKLMFENSGWCRYKAAARALFLQERMSGARPYNIINWDVNPPCRELPPWPDKPATPPPPPPPTPKPPPPPTASSAWPAHTSTSSPSGTTSARLSRARSGRTCSAGRGRGIMRRRPRCSVRGRNARARRRPSFRCRSGVRMSRWRGSIRWVCACVLGWGGSGIGEVGRGSVG